MTYGRDDFESIVRRHQAMVYSIGYQFFHNASLAEELAQDVFLQFYEQTPIIESPSHLVSWLRRASTHRCIDALRKRGTRGEVEMEGLPEIAGPSIESDPLRDEKLQKLVASLPEKQRAIVILRFGEDMEATEIAEVLDMPLATVRSHLHRALAALREKVSRSLGEVNHGSI